MSAGAQALRRTAERAAAAASRLVAGQPTPHTHAELLRPGDVLPGIAAAEFALRRKRLSEQLPPGSVAIIPAARQVYMAGVIPYPYRPDADFLYLTGVQQPAAMAVLRPDSNFTLVVPDADPWKEQWDGARLSEDAAAEFFGADHVATASQLPKLLASLLPGASTVLCDADRAPADLLQHLGSAPSSVRDRLRPLRPLMHRLRWLKSPAELELMRQSAGLAAGAMLACMHASQPGVSEARLAALFAYRCSLGGAQRMAYPPVVAGGTDALTIHYSRNDKCVPGGQMLLLDGGCELHGYCSDVTRTWPVGGTYSPQQRALYEAVLEAHKECVAACQPGATLRDLHHRSVQLLSAGLARLGMLPGRSASSIAAGAYRAFYPHSVCHWLGMDTHDCGTVSHDLPLEPGAVLTIEPGLYIPDDEMYGPFRGLGIRIEDDVAITQHGQEVLSAAVPVDPQEIEALVGTAGAGALL